MQPFALAAAPSTYFCRIALISAAICIVRDSSSKSSASPLPIENFCIKRELSKVRAKRKTRSARSASFLSISSTRSKRSLISVRDREGDAGARDQFKV